MSYNVCPGDGSSECCDKLKRLHDEHQATLLKLEESAKVNVGLVSVLAARTLERDEALRRLDEALKSTIFVQELQGKLDIADARNTELHRRCQFAEGAVLRKMKAEQVAGAPITKRLAIAGYKAEQERANELERRLDKLLGAVSGYLAGELDRSDLAWLTREPATSSGTAPVRHATGSAEAAHPLPMVLCSKCGADLTYWISPCAAENCPGPPNQSSVVEKPLPIGEPK